MQGSGSGLAVLFWNIKEIYSTEIRPNDTKRVRNARFKATGGMRISKYDTDG